MSLASSSNSVLRAISRRKSEIEERNQLRESGAAPVGDVIVEIAPSTISNEVVAAPPISTVERQYSVSSDRNSSAPSDLHNDLAPRPSEAANPVLLIETDDHPLAERAHGP